MTARGPEGSEEAIPVIKKLQGEPANITRPTSTEPKRRTEVQPSRLTPTTGMMTRKLWLSWGVRKLDIALFYRSLGELLRAGVAITRALDTAARTTANPILRRCLTKMRSQIESGTTLAEAMENQPHIFPPLHTELINIAERSGRIDPVLRELADFTERLIQMRRTILTGLALPIFYIHAVVFIPRLPDLVLGNTSLGGYLMSSFGALAFLYALVLGGLLAVRIASRSRYGIAVLDGVIRPIPIIGKTWRELDYWRIASGMEMLINAGLGVISALRQCASFCRSPRIAGALRRAADEAEAGGTVSLSLDQSGEFPAEMISLWATGEESGRLDEMLMRSAKYFADRCQHRMQMLSKWLPRIIYFGVIIYVAWYILSFWTGYYGGLQKEMN